MPRCSGVYGAAGEGALEHTDRWEGRISAQVKNRTMLASHVGLTTAVRLDLSRADASSAGLVQASPGGYDQSLIAELAFVMKESYEITTNH